MLIGYARVSTSEQDTALQMDALRRAGVSTVYQEKTSSVGKRPELQRALAALQSGHTLVVWKLDRIARSLHDLLGILAKLKARGIGLRSLTEPIDTSSPIGEFMVQVLGAVAQLERAMITQRSIAGQQAAKARGVHCGRPLSITEATANRIMVMHRTGRYTMRAVALAYGVSESVVKRLVYGSRR